MLTPRVMSEDISLLLDEAVMLTPKAVLLDEAGPGSGNLGILKKAHSYR